MDSNSKLLVLTSGGDAPGMNMALYVLAQLSRGQGVELWGVEEGFRGLIEGQTPRLLAPQALVASARSGGTVLGTSRFPEFKESSVQMKAADWIRSFGAFGLFVIGGGGSYQGAKSLAAQGIRTVALPASIDNDVPGTQSSIGVFSAIERITQALDHLSETAVSHNRTMILEVMGHRCQALCQLAAMTAVCDAAVFRPEHLSIPWLSEKVCQAREGKRGALICVTEQMCDVYWLAKTLEQATGFETRANVLGHLQRGGAPAVYDRLLANRLSHMAFHRITSPSSDPSGEMVGWHQGKAVVFPLSQATGEAGEGDNFNSEFLQEIF